MKLTDPQIQALMAAAQIMEAHDLSIGSCGCCHSPWVLTGGEQAFTKELPPGQGYANYVEGRYADLSSGTIEWLKANAQPEPDSSDSE